MAKLKAKGGMDALNKSKLTLLINFAMRNVDVSKNLSAGPVSTLTMHFYCTPFTYFCVDVHLCLFMCRKKSTVYIKSVRMQLYK